MLYAFVPGSKGTLTSWHVGEDFGEVHRLADITPIIGVQADGDELMHIERNFPAFVCKKNVQRWYGDIARMILGNL